MVTQTLDLDGIEKFGPRVSGFEDVGAFRIYRLEWKNGDWAAIYRNGDWLHWDWLQTDRTGHYHDMMGATDFFARQGITHYSSGFGGADDALRATGFEDVGGYLLYDIAKGRYPEYAAWKSGKGRKPAWR